MELQFTATKCHFAIWNCTVTFHPTQVNTPSLNLSLTGWYSIYLPWRDGRLSWHRWLVTLTTTLHRHIYSHYSHTVETEYTGLAKKVSQKLWKLASSRQSYCKKYTGLLFWPTLYVKQLIVYLYTIKESFQNFIPLQGVKNCTEFMYKIETLHPKGLSRSLHHRVRVDHLV